MTEAFDGSEGRITVRRWVGEQPPRHIVLLAHGYGEHSGRYEQVAATLVEHGAAVLAPDHIGHGHSDGERVLVTDFEHVVDDLHTVAGHAATAYPDLPTVLIGHSLGGLIAARYAQRYRDELAGLVLSAPVLGTWSSVTGLLALPEIPEPEIDPALLSRDPAVGVAAGADDLVHKGPFRQQTIRAIAGALQVVNTGPALDGLPTLWLHGQNDELVPLAETKAGIELLAPHPLTTRIYRDARHEVFNETNRAEVLRDTTDFIASVTG